MHAPYNLATRPFRNQTLPALLLAAGWLLLVAGTAVHVMAVRRLLPASTSARHREVADLERRLQRLEARADSFKLDVPAATLGDWSFVKDLVDRRAFSWTRLLQDLAEALPAGVRVMTLAPDVDNGRLQVELTAAMRSHEDALDLVRRLEASARFSDVTPLSSSDGAQGRQMRVVMTYEPPREGAPPLPAERPGRRRKERP